MPYMFDSLNVNSFYFKICSDSFVKIMLNEYITYYQDSIIFSLDSSSSLPNWLRYVECGSHELSQREEGWAIFESFLHVSCKKMASNTPRKGLESLPIAVRDWHWSLESLYM